MAQSRRRGKDVVIPIILVAFAAVYGWQAMRLPVRNIPGSVGISFVPLLLAGLLAFLSLLLFGQVLRGAVPPAGGDVPGWGQAAGVIGIIGAYIVLLVTVGFLLASPPFVAVAMWRCGARRPWFVLATAVGVTGAVWLVFWSLFGVPLPRGPLG